MHCTALRRSSIKSIADCAIFARKMSCPIECQRYEWVYGIASSRSEWIFGCRSVLDQGVRHECRSDRTEWMHRIALRLYVRSLGYCAISHPRMWSCQCSGSPKHNWLHGIALCQSEKSFADCHIFDQGMSRQCKCQKQGRGDCIARIGSIWFLGDCKVHYQGMSYHRYRCPRR